MKRFILCVSLLVILMVCVVQSVNTVIMADVQKVCQQQAIVENTGMVDNNATQCVYTVAIISRNSENITTVQNSLVTTGATTIAGMVKTDESISADLALSGSNILSVLNSIEQTGAPGIVCGFNSSSSDIVINQTQTIVRSITS
jgi:hypothetical protein